MFEQRLHRQFELTAHWGVRMLSEKKPSFDFISMENWIDSDCYKFD